MKRIDQVLKGYIKLYPKLNGKYIKISLIADRKDNDDFVKVFGDIKYDEAKEKIKQDENYKKEAIKKIYDYYEIDDCSLITDATGDVLYFIKLIDNVLNNTYTPNYIEKIEALNNNDFFEDYKDLFGNWITFEENYGLKMIKMSPGFNYFLDSEKGVIVDISECIKDKHLMLRQVEDLTHNVTSLVKKDDYYYIEGSKYLNTLDVDKYIEEAFNEIGNDEAKEKNYLYLKHIGSYKDRYKTYEKLLNEIKMRNYKICGIPVEQYIIGIWNETDEDKYETNIMIPIEGRYE